MTHRFRKLGKPWLFIIASFVLITLAIVALVAIHKGWRTASSNGIECQKAFQPLPYQDNGYIEFFLAKQEASEPVFDGSYFINLAQEYGQNPLQLRVMTSGGRAYGDSITIANLRWTDSIHDLWMTEPIKMPFISTTGSHRDFPFDSARFDYTLTTEPWVDIPVFRFNNRVPGFDIPCDAVNVERRPNGSYHVSFELHRDLLTGVTAILLFVAAVFFAFAITIFVERRSVATAVASYFFSLWSIRGILGLGAEGFPTRFDVGILALCLLILFLLGFRFAWVISRAENEDDDEPC
jgi:hypothetical protein